MMRLRYFSCLFLCFVSSLSLCAQSGDFVHLTKVLKQLEKQYQVEFSYIENEIESLKVIPPTPSESLDTQLQELAQQTQLTFNKINSKYISISDNKKKKVVFKGYLQDIEQKKPIEYATILCQPSGQTLMSSAQGYFEINDPNVRSILVTHVNHEPLLIEDISAQNSPIFYLKIKKIQLDEVVTQFLLTKGVTKKWDMGYEIKPKEFGILPGLTEADVFESIKQIPGVISSDETLANLSIRGGTQDQILFQWNGMRLYQVSHFFGLISAINPNLAHKITIVKNGSSPFYGGSVSGVVDISTLSNSKKEDAFNLGINLINADATFRYNFSKKSKLAISSRRAITDLTTTPTYQNYYNRVFQNTIVSDVALNGNLSYQNDLKFYFFDFSGQFSQKIGTKLELIFDVLVLSNQLNLKQSRQENGLLIQKNSSLDQETTGGIVTGKVNWATQWKSEFKLFLSQFELYSNYESLNTAQTVYQRNEIKHLGGEWKTTWLLNPNTTVNFGYQFDEIGNRNINEVSSPSVQTDVTNVIRNHGLISEMRWESSSKKMKASGGIRQNYYERWGVFLTEPRVIATWEFAPKWQLDIAGEMKSQTVSKIVDRQQDFLGIEKRRWILSNNADIPILKNKQLSTSLSYSNKGWLLSGEVFLKKVTGISGRSQGFQNQLENIDFTGNYRIWGGEFLLQKQIKNFIFWSTYTYNYNRYTLFLPTSTLSFPSNNEIMHHWASGIVYDKNNLKLSLGGKWFTGRPTTLPKSQNLVYNSSTGTSAIDFESPNNSRLPNFFQLNSSGSYLFKFHNKHQLTLGASMINVLNTRNKINQFFRINTNSQSMEQVNTFSLERTVNVFIRYTL